MTKHSDINPNKDTILIGFKYDLATEIIFDWLTDSTFLSTHPTENLFRYHEGTLDEQKKLTNQLKRHKDGIVEIFCGHGSDDSLLGPSQNSSKKHYRFYHIDMISDLPGSLFAFSCYSAALFGWFYSCAGKNKIFMGFTEEIVLPLEVISEVKKIFQRVATAMVETGRVIEEHETVFLDSIAKLIKDIENKVITCKAPKLAASILHNYITCFRKH